jgi:hypothetical protein
MVDHVYEGSVCTQCGNLVPTSGLTYELSADGTYYTVTGIGACEEENIVIAGVVEGVPVTEVAALAFAENSHITQVTIPSTVTQIGAGAFRHCSRLTEIVFGGEPSSEIWLGYNGTEHMATLRVGVATAAAYAFSSCFYFYSWTNQSAAS